MQHQQINKVILHKQYVLAIVQLTEIIQTAGSVMLCKHHICIDHVEMLVNIFG